MYCISDNMDTSVYCTVSRQIQTAVLLFHKPFSGGNTQTFVLESRRTAVAIILPGLTVGRKTVKYFKTLHLVVKAPHRGPVRAAGCLTDELEPHQDGETLRFHR